MAADASSLNNVRAYLFFVSPETFHAYCNILLANKSGKAGFASRKLFRQHCERLFKEIARSGALQDNTLPESVRGAFIHNGADMQLLNAAAERYV